MITEKEVNATLLSPTKKDYYQIWNELIELAGKISERWDPNSTNESDPGIVLLKVLTGIADKLNYTIDKNILEAYMPSAAQEESMRKLCDMLGYEMKYYQSANTDVTVYYNGEAEDWQETSATGLTSLTLPKFTVFKNIDGDIVYTSTEAGTMTKVNSTITVPCIEGTVDLCATDNNGIITLDNLDDDFRYYLPVTQVAENGVFIYNAANSTLSNAWTQVNNLNTQALESKVYKFGYDSQECLPYIQFPEDIGSLIKDGLIIYYTTTNGLDGNISAKTISTFEVPAEWSSTDISDINSTGKIHTADEFTCYNGSATVNGANRESINQAYINFKKTAGTFDTLVTCRDYMNKIYQLTMSQTNTTPLVSNSIVSDIKDDINSAYTICSFDGNGISCSTKSIQEYKFDYDFETALPPASVSFYNKVGRYNNKYYKCVKSTEGNYAWGEISDNTKDKLTNFDLVLYPFKTVYNLNTKSEHDSSFKYDESKYELIKEKLDDYKTISHNIKLPADGDITCIKNYLRLNAKITTTTKVTLLEWETILSNIKTALYTNFNLRKLDFSENIPFDDILKTIEQADVKIKNVSLEEPELYSAVMLKDNSEYFISEPSTPLTIDEIKAKLTTDELVKYNANPENFIADKKIKAMELYNKLTIRNILAGRVKMFNYDDQFIPNITESKNTNFDLVYPADNSDYTLKYITSNLTINSVTTDDNKNSATTYNKELTENEIVQFRAPNFRTIVTYPAYVNYYLKLNNDISKYAIPATFITLKDYFNAIWDYTVNEQSQQKLTAGRFVQFMNWLQSNNLTEISTQSDFEKYKNNYGNVFGRNSYVKITEVASYGDNYRVYYNNIFYPIAAENRYADAEGITQDNNGEYLKIKLIDGNKEAIVEIKSYLYKSTNSGENLVYNYYIVDQYSTGKNYYIYQLTSDTYSTWVNFVSSRKDYDTTLSGIYKSFGYDQTRVVGEYIDEAKNKYGISNTWIASTNPMVTYYVQKTFERDVQSDPDTSGQVVYGHTKDGFGKNAVYNSLIKDAEYELQKGEFLCINYTKAENTGTTEEGTIITESTVVNEYYGEGTIIKCNFVAISSDKKVANGSSYSKTSGFDFTGKLPTTITTIPGMHALGANEQIEIRELVKVYVYDELNTQTSATNPVYVYFKLNNEKSTGTVTFLQPQGTASGSSYTLQEGEYFWYTDRNKQKLYYCGDGCKVINHTNMAIQKEADTDTVTTATIFEKGIEAIPWIKITNLYITDPSNPGTNDNYIEWDEYQYINLADSDTLVDITYKKSEHQGSNLTKEWKPCTAANYKLSDTESSLPMIVSSNIADWEVHTKLIVNMNPLYCQTLLAGEEISIYKAEPTVEGSLIKTFNNVSLKSNYIISSAADTIATSYKNLEGELVEDYKIKVFDKQQITKYAGPGQQEQVKLNNINEKYTSIAFNKLPATEQAYSILHCALKSSSSQYGLLMIYYNTNSTIASNMAYITFNGTTKTPVIFNYPSCTNETWWTDYYQDNKCYLKPGINLVKINDSCEIKLFAGTSTDDNVIFDELKVINTDIIDQREFAKFLYAESSDKIKTFNTETNYNTYKTTVENAGGKLYRVYIPMNGSVKILPTETEGYCWTEKVGNDYYKIDLVASYQSGYSYAAFSTLGNDATINYGINLDLLQYNGLDVDVSAEEQLLTDINFLDLKHEFYYSADFDNSTLINVNTYANENLQKSNLLYDYNNINNKFVISELDSDYFSTGIALTRSSLNA